MTKNMGGKKTKRGARMNGPSLFRPPKEEGELVAIMEKNMGNGLIHVKCSDSVLRMCHVRNKFTGSERASLRPGSWLLIGIRLFETNHTHCDLLEVYSDSDVNRLSTMDGPWTIFITKEEVDMEEVETTAATVELDINIDDI